MATDAEGETLHVVPGDSAGGSLLQALRGAGLDDLVLPFLDDLSCGPIDPDDPGARDAWWDWDDDCLLRDRLLAFWDRVAATKARIVVWYSRHAARDYALFLAWADRLGDRPYDVIDVTGQELPFLRPDGTPGVTSPLVSVGQTPTSALPILFGTERPLSPRQREDARQSWRRLRNENAPFRIVTEGGLVSAPADHFDEALLACANVEWQRCVDVSAECLLRHSRPDTQVDGTVLWMRLFALVESGRLLADGDLSDWHAGRVRLPGRGSGAGVDHA